MNGRSNMIQLLILLVNDSVNNRGTKTNEASCLMMDDRSNMGS